MGNLMEAPPAGSEVRVDLTRGALVGVSCVNDPDRDRVIIGRILCLPNFGWGYRVRLVHTAREIEVTDANRLRLVSADRLEEEEEEGKLPLHERIENIRNNIDQTIGKLAMRGKDRDSHDASLLRDFLDLLMGNCPDSSCWFWLLVGESQDNPRQISWAPTMALADSNKRRRRASACKFLLGEGARHGADFSREEAERIGFLCGYHLPESYRYEFVVKNGEEGREITYLDPHDGFGSCMSGKRYTRFYAMNPDKVSFVRIEHNGQYVGRSLLWSVDSGERVLDRIYARGIPDVRALEEHARSQGWTVGETGFSITMRTADEYPYLDTYRYTDDDPEDSGRITLNADGGDYVFDHTDGTYSGDDRETCTDCGERLSDDGCCHANDYTYCQRCYDRSFVYLNYKWLGNWIEDDCAKEDARKCKKCDEWRREDHGVKLVNEDFLCFDCYSDHAACCEECGEYDYWNRMENIDGNHYCEDCWSECEQCGEKVTGECDCWKGKKPEPIEPCRFTLPLPLEFA
jgi:hypothetical protein